MKIIVDMMGGDNAPLAVLEGTAQAVKEYGVQVIGVGSEELVRKTAAEHNIPLDGIELVNCTETIEMCDEPARAIRSKKDSSIVVGLNLLKEGKGDAFVSAGSTGALHVGDGDGHVAADVLFARLAHLRPELHGDAEEDSGEEYCFFGKSHYLCLIVTDKGMIFR